MAGKQEAEVLFEYEKTQDDELSLKVGEIIQDVVQVDEGWCEGTLHGVRGMFPDNFVKLRPAQTTPTAPPTAQPPVTTRDGGGSIKSRRAKVAFSYAAENADELTLQPGQIVEVIAEEEEGWFRGRLDGKEGVFPSNFLDPNPLAESTQPAPEPVRSEETPASKPVMGHKLFPSINPAAALAQLKPSGGDKEKKAPPSVPPPAEKKPPPTGPPPAEKKAPPPVEKKAPPTIPPPAEKKPSERAKVIFEYQAENEDELTINPGDIVEIVTKDTDQDGWWKVRLGDKVGLIPDNFVEILPPSATPSVRTKPPPPMPANNKPPAKETHPPPAKPHPPRSGSVSRPAPPQPDRPPPPTEQRVKEESPEENSDFGVPHTDPLDSTIVKDRPKRTSRPPSRSNLQTGENNEPPPEPKPDKPAPAQNPGLSPWQAELQKRKANKPPPPTPGTRPTPGPKKVVKPPEKPVVKPPAIKSTKPQVEPTPPPTRDSPSPLSPPTSSTSTPTPAQHSAVAPPPDNSWKEAYEKLHDEFEKFKLMVEKRFAMLTSDLDEERKHWRGLEVDIDRLKKQSSLPK